MYYILFAREKMWVKRSLFVFLSHSLSLFLPVADPWSLKIACNFNVPCEKPFLVLTPSAYGDKHAKLRFLGVGTTRAVNARSREARNNSRAGTNVFRGTHTLA